jgi:hypothetical protein
MALYLSAPPVWRALLAELDGRPLDGTPFIRDVQPTRQEAATPAPEQP